jgi:glyoxylase-like metal-dependent hydrolase (beta-lactamase superfamily II)
MEQKVIFIVVFLMLAAGTFPGSTTAAAPIHVDVFVADSTSYGVTSTLISGEHEAILVDVQFRMSEAVKLADRIASTGKQLKAIIISHPDDDHYLCMAVFKQRFPNTPIYMSSAALTVFMKTSARYFKIMKTAFPRETPDSLPTPEVLPTKHFTVDGEEIEVITDVQGDTWAASNCYLWIPSTKTIVAGDLVFNGVHVWLANSTPATRTAWLSSLDQLGALHPLTVVAGHKLDGATPDTPDVIGATRNYIKAFNSAVDVSTGSDDLIAWMKHSFPKLGLPGILIRASRAAIPD